jgi:hypothetical protein
MDLRQHGQAPCPPAQSFVSPSQKKFSLPLGKMAAAEVLSMPHKWAAVNRHLWEKPFKAMSLHTSEGG